MDAVRLRNVPIMGQVSAKHSLSQVAKEKLTDSIKAAALALRGRFPSSAQGWGRLAGKRQLPGLGCGEHRLTFW